MDFRAGRNFSTLTRANPKEQDGIFRQLTGICAPFRFISLLANLAASMRAEMLALLPVAFLLMSGQARAASDAEIIRGFNLTVFGAEYAPFGIQSTYIRKFAIPVRVYVHDLAKRKRRNEIAAFVRSLNSSVRGLTITMTNQPAAANFAIYVVDRADYVSTAREKVYRRSNAAIPGKCMVRSRFSRAGISRSDAVIVSDGGESLFQRCMIEEILQGLGPLNEHPSLSESMFNDRSRHTSFTRFDRTIMNMLYDSRIRTGTNIEMVQALLPVVLRDVKRRMR